jgi:methyl-accepting chemotaxis protein
MFSNLSIRSKLLALILPVVILAFLACALYASWEVKRSAKSEALKSIAVNLDLFNDLIMVANSVVERDIDEKMTLFSSSLKGALSLAPGTSTAPVLKLGGAGLDNGIVDAFTKINSTSVATIYVASGEDFMRVVTSLKQDGGRVVGTALSHENPAYQKLIKGEEYRGKATIFGKPYMTKYVPVKDPAGRVIAVLGVGNNIEGTIHEINAALAKIKVGKTGYAFIFDNSAEKSRGNMIMHPNKWTPKMPLVPILQRECWTSAMVRPIISG